MPSFWMLRRLILVRSDVSEEFSASIIRETRIGELGTTSVLTRTTRRKVPEETRACSELRLVRIVQMCCPLEAHDVVAVSSPSAVVQKSHTDHDAKDP
jgi:hypothetical protein